MRDNVPRPFAMPESREFPSSSIRYIAAKGNPAVISAIASVIIPYRTTRVINALFAMTNPTTCEKFCWDGTKVRGVFRVKNTENQIDKTISGATQIAANV